MFIENIIEGDWNRFSHFYLRTRKQKRNENYFSSSQTTQQGTIEQSVEEIESPAKCPRTIQGLIIEWFSSCFVEENESRLRINSLLELK